MGSDQFAPYKKLHGCFVVLNVAPQIKTIKIFGYPINYHCTRDLLAIPGIAEQDIRASLLKGELQHKILARDIVITCSDIDLLQFNEDQKQFLINSGIIDGLEVGSNQVSGLSYIWRIEIPLIGTKNGINKTFFTPDKFINGTFDTGDDFHIQVKHNGRDLYEDFDYYVSESEGTGTGYDTINLISITPNTNSKLFATYVKRV